ncbi:RasGEF domain containing protein [Acanthamoeba castellanii str. Neff]|uniref:RasGEF domain containing protein n=1 Tax=Acanthamoeba castellanii (strain ATCC 30010 / Neff) TaxID=1257118 RepID=L8GY04_ACACF|nr:RasGEF domain containing protein [Acanthamoeba castellanii str. Neff]ELR16971.1 RasGEF domain containing protein [Acanthamoeba castellanii str. Neff]
MENAGRTPMEALLAVEVWEGIFMWLTSARDLEDTLINQPGDFRRELCYRVGRCVPEYGPIDVDLSTTSLKFIACNQPSADALRSGSLEDILRYIYQQLSFALEIHIVLHNYAAQFTDEELLNAIVYVGYALPESGVPLLNAITEFRVVVCVAALTTYLQPRAHARPPPRRRVAAPLSQRADLQRLVTTAEKCIQHLRLRQQQLQDQKAKDEQRLRRLAEEAAVVAPPPLLQFVHSAPGDELAAELIDHFLRTKPERLAEALTMRAWDSFASITLNELANQGEGLRDAALDLRLNNYATMMAVMAGLNDAACWRLKRTWEVVKASDEVSQTYSALETLIDRRSGRLCYRQALANAALPCLPYLGFMLTDLTFICDGQGTHWQGPGVVPFKKWRLCNDVFTEIGRWQSVPYRLDEQAEVVEHLMRSELFHPADSEELYALSCALEPKTK